MHLRTQVKRRIRYFQRLRQAHYPGYIFGLTPSRGEIPVFCFHEVTTERFGANLSFLQENGYRTLSTKEFVDEQGKVSNERRVLLTFDDARSNFWDVAFPLLRQFNARATLFAPTYWIEGSHGVPAEAATPHYSDARFMNWEQLRICSQSHLVDVQSHCHRHSLICVSQELVDFASPQSLAQFDVYDWPMRRTLDIWLTERFCDGTLPTGGSQPE
jgi:hypothetical protein